MVLVYQEHTEHSYELMKENVIDYQVLFTIFWTEDSTYSKISLAP